MARGECYEWRIVDKRAPSTLRLNHLYNSALPIYLKALFPMLSGRLGPDLDGSGTSSWPSLALLWVVCGDFRCPAPAFVLVTRLTQVRVSLE